MNLKNEVWKHITIYHFRKLENFIHQKFTSQHENFTTYYYTIKKMWKLVCFGFPVDSTCRKITRGSRKWPDGFGCMVPSVLTVPNIRKLFCFVTVIRRADNNKNMAFNFWVPKIRTQLFATKKQQTKIFHKKTVNFVMTKTVLSFLPIFVSLFNLKVFTFSKRVRN